ncbi:phosphoribosylanthranilate isomerase [Bacteroides sp. OF04-15BH]|nr:phosphoribosylanthranilate isomerase [Bacteroides sp. OF04-15BH]
MRQSDNIRQVEALGIDMMGFIFWEPSARYVSQKPDYLPACARTGVFVNASPEYILSTVRTYGLSYVQLHGQESPEFCHHLRQNLNQSGLASVQLIKAFSISTPEDLAPVQKYENLCHFLLFDTKTPLPGGSGKQFEWQILQHYSGTLPFLLSGGIGPNDTHRLQEFHHPLCVGIDLNSRFEISPGLKDATLLKNFLTQLNS